MNNLYATPNLVTNVPAIRRPTGVSIVAICISIYGFFMFLLFVNSLRDIQGTNFWMIRRGQAPLMYWVMTGATVLLSFSSAIGLWKGRKFGWWIVHGLIIISAISQAGRLLESIIVHGSDLVAVNWITSVIAGTVFVALDYYWLTTTVRTFFGVEKMRRLKSVILAAGCTIGLIALIASSLQVAFLLSFR